MFRKNLMPHVHVIKLIGGTGDGKTEISVVFADPGARKILLKCVGSTNSTVRERMIVYTTALSGKIVVVASLNEEILERRVFSDIVITAIAKVIRANGKVIASFVGKDEEELSRELHNLIDNQSNTTAVFNFLTEDQKNYLVDQVVAIYSKYEFHKHGYEAYNATKNKLSDKEVSENSNKFLLGIKSEVERIISLEGKEFTEELLKVWIYTNGILKDKFFEYFDQNSISEDGFYSKELSFDNPDNEFIKAMFTANDLQNGERLSLEVLCGQIFIYTPMNKAVKNIIANHINASQVFMDEHGDYTFGILDPRGLFHTGEDDANGDYLNELLYQGDTDAVAMVIPLFGDTNEKRIYDLFKSTLEKYKKQTPIYMINNKVDMFIDRIRKEDYEEEDPFSTEIKDERDLTADEIFESVSDRVAEIKTELQAAQNKMRKNAEIVAMPCYLKRDGSMKLQEVVNRYNVSKVVTTLLESTADFLVKNAVKIPITLKNEDDVEIIIDRAELAKRVHTHILESETDTKVFSPGSKNIGDNMGICPHGNSYNALKRRLRYGDGYNCKIDETYYVFCKSFSIDFTGNLRNFLTDDFLSCAVHTSTKLGNGRFPTQKDGEDFWKMVLRNINPRKFVSILLYEHALREAELNGFGFGSYFRGFLNNSKMYFEKGMINEPQYVDALEEVIKEAFQKTVSMNVIYR